MPYIARERREVIDHYIEQTLVGVSALGDIAPGDLNYIFTKIAGEYLLAKGLNYQNINDAIGAFEGAKLEFYRRVAAPYENKKIASNGDAFDARLVP